MFNFEGWHYSVGFVVLQHVLHQGFLVVSCLAKHKRETRKHPHRLNEAVIIGGRQLLHPKRLISCHVNSAPSQQKAHKHRIANPKCSMSGMFTLHLP